MTRYLSVTQFAHIHNRPRSTVARWCQVNAIPGVVRVGRQYSIPADAAPPQLPRGKHSHKLPTPADPAARAAAALVQVPDDDAPEQEG
jgi:hypothetical protein